jgi:hypothetical protein
LQQKLVSPVVQRLKALEVIDVEHEDTAVGSTVKGDAEGLETFLACRVPYL